MHVVEQVIVNRPAWPGLGLLLGAAAALVLTSCDGEKSRDDAAASATMTDSSDATASGRLASSETLVATTSTETSGRARFIEAGIPDETTAETSTSNTDGGATSNGATFTRDERDADAASSEPPRSPTLGQLQSQYSTWQPHTAEPVNVSTEIFVLCRSPNAAEQAFVESAHGGYYLRNWLNPEAQAAFADLTSQDAGASRQALPPSFAEFPDGAAIVKEKLILDTNGEYRLAALGVMVKREQGYDGATGDWEFGYWEPDVGMLSGLTENATCGPCHAGAPRDFVFLDHSWRIDDAR